MSLELGEQTTAYGSFGTATDESYDRKEKFKLFRGLLLLPLLVSVIVFAIPMVGSRYLTAKQSAQQPESLFEHDFIINASGIYVKLTSDTNETLNFKLSCADYDDDQYYPVKPGGDLSDPSSNCEVQDGSQTRCRECLANQVLKSHFPAPHWVLFDAGVQVYVWRRNLLVCKRRRRLPIYPAVHVASHCQPSSRLCAPVRKCSALIKQ